ncbi:hypothetical protein JXM67_15410 [candidate division WOR-3 bacterium]|nr:hypothetical protein [candidate division WOR-3 bacterium]
MTRRASHKSLNSQTLTVRFIQPVKMGGRWYSPGEEVSLSDSIAREFLQLGLVEKLNDKTRSESSGSSEEGD